MTIKEAYDYALLELQKNNILSPRLDTEVLLSHTLNVDKTFIYSNDNYELSNDNIDLFYSLVKRRISKEPIAYIVGHKEFYGLQFKVNQNVLIPRPETEHLVQYIIDKAPRKSTLLDICTGSGCIPISVEVNRRDISTFFSDISKTAIEVAKDNYREIRKKEPFYFISDMFKSIPKDFKFNIISANTPYVKSGDLLTVDESIKWYEPKLALDGGKDGLDYYKILFKEAYKFLYHLGEIVIEIDPFVYSGIITIINSYNGLYKIKNIINDYFGNERTMVLKYNG